MFERLVLCEYAVADLTTANANVFYELGLRHAARPHSTILLFSRDGRQLPFDVGSLRAMPYELHPDGTPADIETTKAALVKNLRDARQAATHHAIPDSPVFQLVEGYPSAIDHTKTDVFRAHVQYAAERKKALATARLQGVEALQACEQRFGPLADLEAGVVIDLFLSYRAVAAWEEMIALVDKMPRPLAATAMVQEQLALALNRAGRGEAAERVLTDLIARRGPSSETYGILGRVYKDRWQEAARRGNTPLARGLLNKAIDAYLRGFEADWRDAYPGINALTLMAIKDPPDPRCEYLLPVVTYAVERRIAAGTPDYWDHASRLELAVLTKDEPTALEALSNALAAVRGGWEPATTANNLRLLREARERRHEPVPWTKPIEEALEHGAQG